MGLWARRKALAQPVEETAPATDPPGADPGTQALEILVGGLFDYAGVFPPAALELDAAIWESARSPLLTRPHLVGSDLVVPLHDVGRLDEERLRMAGFGDTEATVAVVGVESAAILDAAETVASRNKAMAGVMRLASLEVHGTSFPAAALQEAAAALPDVQVYIEPRMPDASWRRNADGLLSLLERLETNDATVGLKVRGAGATAVTPRTLGGLLPRVAALGIPFKATAGLHHPLVEAQYGNALGFVGLAAALRLRQALGTALSPDDVVRCVAETQAEAFSFDGELSWRGHAVDMETLRQVMQEQPFSIGSCSLAEPDGDLARIFGAPQHR